VRVYYPHGLGPSETNNRDEAMRKLAQDIYVCMYIRSIHISLCAKQLMRCAALCRADRGEFFVLHFEIGCCKTNWKITTASID